MSVNTLLQSCVIPLHNLLVREKRDAKDSLGIYMISQNRVTPEMYELVCQSKNEREDWIRILQEAIRACPPDLEPELWPAINPGMTLSNEDEKRRKDEHANQVKLIIGGPGFSYVCTIIHQVFAVSCY